MEGTVRQLLREFEEQRNYYTNLVVRQAGIHYTFLLVLLVILESHRNPTILPLSLRDVDLDPEGQNQHTISLKGNGAY